MLGLVKPKFFLPVHGEYHHLKKHASLAKAMGIDPKNIFMMDIGKVLELDGLTAKIAGTVSSGKVLVDGLGVGDVGNIVLRDRKHLAQDGLIVIVCTVDSTTGLTVAGPDIVSRGFVYVRESEALMDEAKSIAKTALEKCSSEGITEWSALKAAVKDSLSEFLYEKTKRNPMILPIIMSV
jgi:ribonuclease J